MNRSLVIILCAVACLALGTASGFSTADEIKNWYSTIQKPSWNPPNWLFGPVWSTLYILMGIALGLILTSSDPSRSQAVRLFVIQFIFNLAWSFIFFKLHAIGWAFLEIILMWLLILATIVAFHKINRTAAYLLIPYLAWVSFATVLNGTIWYLNRV